MRVLALVPDEGKAAAAFRAVAAAFVPASSTSWAGPDLVRRAVDQAERLRLYAAAEARCTIIPCCSSSPTTSWSASARLQHQKKAKEAESVGRGPHAAAGGAFYPDYVDMIFGAR